MIHARLAGFLVDSIESTKITMCCCGFCKETQTVGTAGVGVMLVSLLVLELGGLNQWLIL